MDFGEVLKKAWKIVWKFKILWIFGIFAGCGTNRGGVNFNGGGSSFSNGGLPGLTPNSPSPNLPPGLEDNLLRILQFIETPAFIIGFIIFVFVIIFIVAFFNIMGKVGLIQGALDADAGAEHLGFGGLWQSGLHYFWRFLGLTLLIGSPIFLIYLVLLFAGLLVLFAYITGSQNSSFGLTNPAFFAIISVLCVISCLVFLLAIVLSFLSPQAERAIVIENEGVISGIRRGWNVLTKNLGPILIVWIILVVISVVAGVLIALPLLIIVAPAVIAFAVSMAAGGNNLSYTPLIFAGLCIVAYIPVSLVANGILAAYTESVWTLTFLRLTQPKPGEPSPVIPQNA
jgi:hypothetical protein